jgi:hypothetical protein
LTGLVVTQMRSAIAAFRTRRHQRETKEKKLLRTFPSKHKVVSFRGNYATPADFCNVFQKDMKSLYVLVLLLTANQADAEKCFVESTKQLAETSSVFKEWAASWTKRCLIKNAIAVVFSKSYGGIGDRNPCTGQPGSPLDAMVDAVTKLETLERFVFVMSILERYSAQECSLLLNCTVVRVNKTRILALRHLGRLEPKFSQESVSQTSRSGIPRNAYPFIATLAFNALTM